MKIEPIQYDIDTLCYKLNIPKKEQQFFGYILESIDNLATHSKNESADSLSVFVPKDAREEFEDLLAIYSSYNRTNVCS